MEGGGRPVFATLSGTNWPMVATDWLQWPKICGSDTRLHKETNTSMGPTHSFASKIVALPAICLPVLHNSDLGEQIRATWRIILPDPASGQLHLNHPSVQSRQGGDDTSNCHFARGDGRILCKSGRRSLWHIQPVVFAIPTQRLNAQDQYRDRSQSLWCCNLWPVSMVV